MKYVPYVLYTNATTKIGALTWKLFGWCVFMVGANMMLENVTIRNDA